MRGLLGLHGGGEYAAGDEAALDALIAAAAEAAAAQAPDVVPRVVIVPTAAARQRPDVAARHGERAVAAAAARAAVVVEITVATILTREDAADPDLVATLASAHLVHLPGGDPDLIPHVFRSTPAWNGMLRASARGAVLAGASAGAMAMAERCWTPGGLIDGLGVVPGLAILPHYAPGRLERWRGTEPAAGVRWLGIDEQTLVLGRPGEAWRVAGRGSAHLLTGDGTLIATAGPGETLRIG
jgi:cyanophycinase-like exopeptidase